MNFDVIFEIWNSSDQIVRRKLILSYKLFYLKGKDYISKTKTRRVVDDYRGDSITERKLLREHDMIRKAYDTRNDFFKYRLKPLKYLNIPKNWKTWGINKNGFLHSLYLEDFLGKNMFEECLKEMSYISLKALVDTFKTLEFHYFKKVFPLTKGKLWSNIEDFAYKTTKKIPKK